MVSDSADNIFDRIQDIVQKRTGFGNDTKSLPDGSPDLVVEENPIIIGETKEEPKQEEKIVKEGPKKEIEHKNNAVKKTKKKSIKEKRKKAVVRTKNKRVTKRKASPKKAKVKIIKSKFPKKVESEISHDLVEDVSETSTKQRLHNSIFSSVAETISNNNSSPSPFHEKAIKSLRATHIQKVKTEPHSFIEYNQSVGDAFKLMHERNLPEITITKDGEVVGALSKNKIADYYYSKLKGKSAEDKKMAWAEVGAIPISKIMNPKPVVLKTADTLHTAMSQMDEKNTETAVIVSNGKPKGLLTRENISTHIINAVAPTQVNSKSIETGFDRLLNLVEKESRISTESAARSLKVKREVIEEWASILEDHNLIRIEYPIVGTIELIKK
jgi:CBS domain-containing protein